MWRTSNSARQSIVSTPPGRFVVPTNASDKPILVMKKFGALALIIAGGVMAAYAVNAASTGIGVVGFLFLVAGAILLTLKVLRRNQELQ
jgi:hypothetical protein